MISRAAICIRGTTYSLPPPARHHDVIAHVRASGITEPQNQDWVQGFELTDGRFVDRIEAARIALESGQIKELQWPPNLYSEDLW